MVLSSKSNTEEWMMNLVKQTHIQILRRHEPRFRQTTARRRIFLKLTVSDWCSELEWWRDDTTIVNSSAHAYVDLPVTMQLYLLLDHFPIGSLVSGMTGKSVGRGNLVES